MILHFLSVSLSIKALAMANLSYAEAPEIHRFACKYVPTSVTISKDKSKIAIGLQSGTILLRSLEDKDDETELKGHNAAVTSASFDADGAVLFSSSSDGTVRKWVIKDGKHTTILEHKRQRVIGFDYSLSDQTILTATGSPEGSVRHWDPRRQEATVLFSISSSVLLPKDSFPSVASLARSAKGDLIAIGTHSGLIILDTKRQKEVSLFEGDKKAIQSVAFSRDCKYLACFQGGTIYLLDTLQWKKYKSLQDQFPCRTMVFSADGRYLFAGMTTGEDEACELNCFSVPELNLLSTVKCHKSTLNQICLSADGSLLATAGGDGSVMVWDVARFANGKK